MILDNLHVPKTDFFFFLMSVKGEHFYNEREKEKGEDCDVIYNKKDIFRLHPYSWYRAPKTSGIS